MKIKTLEQKACFRFLFAFLLLACFVSVGGTSEAIAQKKKKKNKVAEKSPFNAVIFNGLKFRSIGPSFASGRIADFAVNPNNFSEYYVGVASGNVWKTSNSGVTFKPVFDKYGSYSIADVEIDPSNTNVVWVGTGEYNSQRAIGYGDGVYLSKDGGKTFKNMGLKKTEHIGRIIIDPRNSHVYVAAQGPLWGAGGERGLYKSIDMGKSWKKILDISENTGINDIVMDPRNPDVLYASSYQRRRHVFTLINGGPEGAIYKSTDAGENWEKLTNGLPTGNVGRIGLTISPVNPDIVYAIIEAEGKNGGFFKTTDRGASWTKVSEQGSSSPQYYHRIFADPKDADKVFSMDTRSKYTTDGGKTFKGLSMRNRHVDDHALWINPTNTNHLLIGGDGGVYESFDMGTTWQHKNNLPVTQFYRLAVDNDLPFYNVYGGTQDNNSMGGPSRTINQKGIVNDDWIVTNGGDGFFSQIDPKNPNIVYAEAQYGWAVRYDKKSGEAVSIQPQPPKGEAYRWNWNAPLIISPHSNTRLYFAANKLFRSDDRGNSWKTISPDLSRQLDRNKLKVMGKIQSPDAIAKSASTSLFGNIVSLDESKFKAGLLYVGTDDGLIQVSENGGEKWTKYSTFPGVPSMTYVSCLKASVHDENVVYAAFDARKKNNLKPFLLKSSDKGKTWTSIVNNLPDRGTVYTIIEDNMNKELLFAGTEFGIYFTLNGGEKWIQLKGGLPTIAVKDIKIQERESDLVIATFGRGFYILDNYALLRTLTKEDLEKEAVLFDVKDALMFMQERPRYGQGETYYAAKNPPLGAVFSYYLKEKIMTKKEIRKKAEKEAFKNKTDIYYPSFEELRAEDEQEKPYLLFTVRDAQSNIIRRLKAAPVPGINRVVWDFKYASIFPVSKEKNPFENKTFGMFVAPGEYSVQMSKVVDGIETKISDEKKFKVVPLNNTTLPAKDRTKLTAFHLEVGELAGAIRGAAQATKNYMDETELIRVALHHTKSDVTELTKQTIEIQKTLKEVKRKLSGDESISRRNGNQPPSIMQRISIIFWGGYASTSEPTEILRQQYKIAGECFIDVLETLKDVDAKIKAINKQLEKLKAPWTPSRLPEWKMKKP